MHALIVGGGWAGLAAAVVLADHGVAVTLLEAAPEIGGRARRVCRGAWHVDNGQHVLLGAYRHCLELLRRIDVAEASVFHRRPMELRTLNPAGRTLHLKTPALPAPLHMLMALAGCRGLSPGERYAALRLSASMALHGYDLAQDLSVADWLAHHRQPANLRSGLWEPLCVAALNTPPEKASTRVFLRVLRDAFARSRRDSDLLLPRRDLSAILPDPASAFITARGGRIHLGRRVTGLDIDRGRIRGVETARGRLTANQVVLALPVHGARRLLANQAPLAAVVSTLEGLRHQPICTVYLQYPPETALETEMLGLTGCTTQWVFDHGRLRARPGLMAAVISAEGPHMVLDNPSLARQTHQDLLALHPGWPAPRDTLVIREKRATFSCEVGSDALRPAQATPVQGLWLAGDYTATPYPGTLEGAIMSGHECARAILETT